MCFLRTLIKLINAILKTEKLLKFRNLTKSAKNCIKKNSKNSK